MNFKRIISIGLATIIALQTVVFAHEKTFSPFAKDFETEYKEASVVTLSNDKKQPLKETTVDNDLINDEKLIKQDKAKRKRINPRTDKYEMSEPTENEVRVIATYKSDDGKRKIESLGFIQDKNVRHYIGEKHSVLNISRNGLYEVLEDKESYVIENDHLVFKTSTSQTNASAFSTEELFENNYPSSVDATEISKYHDNGINGSGVKIAILDTGLNTKSSELNICGGATFVEGSDSFADDNGHGTAMAGIIGALMDDIGLTGIAPNVELYSVKVLDSNGIGRTSAVVEGVYWAVENDMDIVYFGFATEDYSYALETAVENAYNNGILMIAPAGNDNSNKSGYPAQYENVISVGSIDADGTKSDFSNYGNTVDLYAPGNEIDTILYFNNKPTPVSGTSASAAHVVGYAALVIDKNKEEELDIFEYILSNYENENVFSSFASKNELNLDIPSDEVTEPMFLLETQVIESASAENIIENNDSEIELLTTNYAATTNEGKSVSTAIEITNYGVYYDGYVGTSGEKVYFCTTITSMMQVISFNLESPSGKSYRIYYVDPYSGLDIDVTNESKLLQKGTHYFYVTGKTSSDYSKTKSFGISLDSLSVTNIEETYYDGSGVYAATGNYSRTFTDIKTVVGGTEFSIKRYYNSKNENRDNDVLTFSRGWSLNYEANVTYKELTYWIEDSNGDKFEHVEITESQLCVMTPEGSILYFTIFMEDGILRFIPMNSRAEVDSNADLSTTIKVTMPDQTTYYYAPLKYTSSTIDELKDYPKGYLYKVKDKYGNTTDIKYNSNDRITSIEDPIGNVYSFTYNSNGNLTKISDQYGREAIYAYDGSNLIQATDAGGITHYYSYSGGYLRQIKNANNAVVNEITYAYFRDENSTFVDLEERIKTLTDENGTTYEYEYDLINNKTVITEIPSNEDGFYRETSTSYDEEKKVTLYIDAENNRYSTQYYTHIYGNRIIDDNGNVVYNTEDRYYFECDNGEILKYVDCDYITTEYKYEPFSKNGLAKSKTVTDVSGTVLEYEEYNYNSNGDVILLESWISRPNSSNERTRNAKRFVYDGTKLIKKAEYLPIIVGTVKVPELNNTNLSKYAVTSYEYDNENVIKGLVSKVVYPAQYTGAANDKGWVYEYDVKGNRISAINPESSETNVIKDTYEYNNYGLVKKHISGEGVVTEYEYNNNLQETKKIVTTEKGTEVTLTEYGNLGLPVQIVSPIEYDSAFEENDGTYSDKTVGVRYTYNDNGTLASETDNEGNSIQYEYDRYGNISRKILPNNGVYSYTYDDISALENIYFKNSYDPGHYEGKGFPIEEHENNYSSNEHRIYKKNRNIDTVSAMGEGYNHFGKVTTKFDMMSDGIGVFYKARFDLQGNIQTEYTKNHSYLWYRVHYTHKNFDSLNNSIYDEKFSGTTLEALLSYNVSTPPSGFDYKYERADYDKNGNVVRTLVSTVSEGSTPTLADANVIKEVSEYYADNLLKSKTDIYGVKTGYEYDKDRHLSKVTVTEPGKAPQIIAYTNNHNGKPETIKTYVNDANVTDSENLLSDGLGTYTLTTNTYDKNGNLIKQVSNTGLTTEYTYNANNLQESVTSYETGNASSARTESVVYDSMGNVVSQTDENGNVTRFVYNQAGYLLYTIYPNGKTAFSERDLQGKVIFEVAAGDYIGSVNAENANTSTYLLDRDNLVEMNRTEYTYDQFDRVVKVTRHTYDTETNTNTSVVRQTNTFDIVGNLATTTDANGNITGYEYDAFGKCTKYIDPSKHGTVGEYTTFYKYDMLGRKIKEGNSNGDYYAYTYDKNGNILNSAIVEGGESQTISTYTYDNGGRILTQTDGNGHTTTLVYDDNNRLMKQYAHGGINDETKTDYYSYDVLGNLTDHTTRNGDTIEYEYDVFNRLIKMTGDDGIVTYTYDKNGNIITMTDPAGTTSYTYDSMDRILTKTNSVTGTVSYEYDIYENIPYGYAAERTIEPDGDIVEKWYDSEDKIVKVIDGTDITWYSYYGNGRLKSTTKPDGSISTNTYDGEGNLLTLVTLDEEYILDSFTYVYDDNSIGYKNQISKTEIVAGENKGTTSYEYDIQGRLTKVTNPNGSTNEYTYDNAGNRLTKTATSGEVSVVTTYTYDNENRLTQSVAGNTITYYGYDNNGNQVSEWTRVSNTFGTNEEVDLSFGLQNEATDNFLTLYGYDSFDRLVKIEQGADVIENVYTADGKKLSRTTNGEVTYYVYDGNAVIEEQNSENEESARNVYGRNLITREDDSNKIVYGFNGHGDVVYQADIDGTVLETYNYDEFGNPAETAFYLIQLREPEIIEVEDEQEKPVSIRNPYRYAGYEYIEEVGLYDLSARYYNPETARFISADPYYNLGNRVIGLYEINVPNVWSIIQANALYAYCGNNPVFLIDISGLDAILINKLVDNGANNLSVEHMGAFFQDEDDNWWFFFWGDKVKYVMVDDNSIFDSLDEINEWLVDYYDPTDPELKLLSKEYPYRDSVYIKGDFTESHAAALQLKENFDTKTWQKTSWFQMPINLSNEKVLKIENRDYRLFSNNCSQVTMQLFMLGILPSGTSVEEYVTKNEYGIGIIPNMNMNNMQSVFYNKATNLSGFEKAMQKQRDKYQNKWNWVQTVFYGALKENIETISPSS